MKSALLGLALPVVSLMIAAPAAAQEFVPEEAPEAFEEAESPWDFGLVTGISGSIATSKAVVGQVDGPTYTASVSLNGSANYRHNRHEWDAQLHLTEAVSRSPALRRFIKAADSLQFETAYFFHVDDEPAHGPFVLAALETSIFAGSDNRAAASTYRVRYLDGTTEDFANRTTFGTTDGFAPMLLRQTLGYFVRPLTETWLAIDIRAGAGAREMLANDQYALSDDGATAEIEINELQSYQQAGAEGQIDLSGSCADGKVLYGASYNIMTPFVNSLTDDPRSPGELTNQDFTASAGLRLTSWASLDYAFRALKQPSLVEDWQISNSLLLTITATLVD